MIYSFHESCDNAFLSLLKKAEKEYEEGNIASEEFDEDFAYNAYMRAFFCELAASYLWPYVSETVRSKAKFDPKKIISHYERVFLSKGQHPYFNYMRAIWG